MRAIQLQRYEDPAHGWLKVPFKLIDKLNLRDKIGSGSYVKGNFVYLEEDEDCTFFFDAIIEQYSEGLAKEFFDKVKTSWTNNSSKIRKYSHYENIDFNAVEEYRDKLLKNTNWNSKAKRQIRNATIDELRYWIKNHYDLGIYF
jgi:methyltransferase-like protein